MIPLLRARTREVYRLYREDEFVHGEAIADSGGLAASITSSRDEDRERTIRLPAEQWLRRLAGLAVLAGALGAVGWLVALSSTRSLRVPAQRRREGAPAASAHHVAVASPLVRVRRKGAVTARRRGLAHARRSTSRRRSRRVQSRPRLASRRVPVSPSVRPAAPKPAEFGFERGEGR